MNHTVKQVLLFAIPPLLATSSAILLTIPGVAAFLLCLIFFGLLAPFFERKPLNFALLLMPTFIAICLLFNASCRQFFQLHNSGNNIFAQIGILFSKTLILGDGSLVVGSISLIFLLIFYSRIKKTYFRNLPNAIFERRYAQVHKVQQQIAAYLKAFFLTLLISLPLWGAAAYFLEFRPISGIMITAACAAAVPFWGMFAAAALLVPGITAEFAILQAGGLLILLSLNWFINYLLNIHAPLALKRNLQILVFIAIALLLNIPANAAFLLPLCVCADLVLEAILHPES